MDAMCAGLPMTMQKWFCRSSALCGLSLVAATTSHSMPNGVLLDDSEKKGNKSVIICLVRYTLPPYNTRAYHQTLGGSKLGGMV